LTPNSRIKRGAVILPNDAGQARFQASPPAVLYARLISAFTTSYTFVRGSHQKSRATFRGPRICIAAACVTSTRSVCSTGIGLRPLHWNSKNSPTSSANVSSSLRNGQCPMSLQNCIQPERRPSNCLWIASRSFGRCAPL
jgi:hypothetical protein